MHTVHDCRAYSSKRSPSSSKSSPSASSSSSSSSSSTSSEMGFSATGCVCDTSSSHSHSGQLRISPSSTSSSSTSISAEHSGQRSTAASSDLVLSRWASDAPTPSSYYIRRRTKSMEPIRREAQSYPTDWLG